MVLFLAFGMSGRTSFFFFPTFSLIVANTLNPRSTSLIDFNCTGNYSHDAAPQLSRTDWWCMTMTETPDSLNNNPPMTLSSQPLGTTILSASKRLTLLDTYCKRNHAICVFLRLAYFTEHNVLQVHGVCLLVFVTQSTEGKESSVTTRPRGLQHATLLMIFICPRSGRSPPGLLLGFNARSSLSNYLERSN